MSFKYIKDYYGVAVKRGQRVKVKRKHGWIGATITSASHYINVRPDDSNHTYPYHPTDTDYIRI